MSGPNKLFIKNQALNASFNSAAVAVGDAGVYNITMEFTGATCSFSTQLLASSEPFTNQPGFVPSPASLVPIENSSLTFTESGSQSYNVSQVGYVWVVVQVTDNSSGTNDGTLSARLNVNV